MKLHTYKTKFDIYHRNEEKDSNVSLFHCHTIIVKIRSKKKICKLFNNTFVVSENDIILPYIQKSKFNYIVLPNQGISSIGKYIYDQIIAYDPVKLFITRCPLTECPEKDIGLYVKALTRLIYTKTRTTKHTKNKIEKLKYDCMVMTIGHKTVANRFKNIWI
jgi:hypothetical protein